MLSGRAIKMRGFTILELMIGITIGLLVVAFVTTIYLTNLNSTRETVNAVKLDSEMRAAIAYITDEIRRAGYWAGSVTENTSIPETTIADPAGNPFIAPDLTNLEVSEMSGEVASSCITFSYDRDRDGVVDEFEKRGVRLNSGVIQVRPIGDSASGTVTANNCESGSWQSLNNGNTVMVSRLSFTVNPTCINVSIPSPNVANAYCYPPGTSSPSVFGTLSGHRLVESKSVLVRMEATLVSDPAVTKILEELVHVRNRAAYMEP